ncbi:PREDICTED: titin-like [Cyprinodon variegatus]|uniref:titin-like n=1 Tax=Cyprinodon variegatus TaxID=28743 RepID=UPI000742A89F|nr:PREDICTED: titin-like [Cyprinodon variegatus]
MNPEPDSPFSRVERTLVSVWCYITEAVSRFLRPQPAETANNDPNSIQESNVDDDAPGGMQTGADTSGEETCEEQPFQTVSLLSSSSPAVPWEQCIADVDVKPKQDQENKEDMREDEFGLTGNDHAESEGENACQERQEKSEKKNSDTYEENETTENNEEHATVGSGHMLLKDVVSDEMDSRVEEVEHLSAERLDECLKVVETMKEPQEDDGQEKKEGLEEESKIKDCSSAEKEESNAETEEQRYIKATGVMLGDVNICQDSQQLSLEFSEFSGFAKDEKKEPGKSKTDDEPEQKKSSRAVEDVQQEEHVVSLKPAGREDDPSTREDQFGPRAHDSAEKMITEDITEQVGPEITQLHICVEESVDKTEDQANAGSKNTVNEEICEEIKKINKVAAAGGDSVGTLTLYGSQDVEQAKEDMEDENSNVEVDKEEDNENSRKMEEEKLCSFSKEEDSNEETGEQMESKAPTVIPGDAKICEDALELSSKQEKSQTETQHPLCQELSDLAEVESVRVADIIEEEPNESAKHEEPYKKSSLAVIDVQKVETVVTQSITACEDDRGKAEEEFGLKENISTEQLITEEMTGHQIGQELSDIQQLNMFIEREGVKNIEDQTKAGSAHTENVLICEGMEIKDEEAAAGGDTVSTLRLDSFPQENEDTVLVDESSKIKEHQAEENEEDFKEESGVKLWTIVEEKESNEETEEKREDEGAAVMLGDANIYEETLQLSPELENKSEDGTHSEVLHIFSKELSSSTKDDTDTEEKDSSKSETDEEPEEKGSRAAEDVQHDKTVFTPNVTGSKDYPGIGEKQFGLTGQNSAEQLIAEDMMEHHLETEKMDTKQLQTLVEKEDIKNTENQIQVGSNDTVNEPICEEIEKGDERAAPGEDPKSTVSLDGSQIVDEALENLKDKANNIQEDKLEKNEEDIEMEHEVKLCTISKEEESNEEGGEQREWEASTARLEDAQICDDALQLSPRQDNSEERRQAETQLVCKELSGLAEDEMVLVADTEEEDPSKSKMDEESKQKGSRAAEDVQDENTCEGHDVFESKEDQACVGSDTGKKAICEEIEKRDEKDAAGEDPKSTVSLDGSPKDDEAKDSREERSNIQEDEEKENEQNFEKQSGIKLSTVSKEEDKNEETGEQREIEAGVVMLEDGIISEDTLQFSPEKQHASDEKTEELDELIDENVQMTIEDVGLEENVSIPETTTFKEEDLLETIIQNATEKNVTMEDISTDENTEIAAGERLSIEVNEEGCVERVCITTPVTVIAEGESAREINTGFNNIPLGVIEGQAAQSAELDAEAHEETPEAVPEYNNDLESDANSTQSFLEEGNSEEIQNTDLPEEVGVFKSSSTGGAEYLPIGQGSAEESRNELEFIEKEQTETPRSREAKE